MMISDELKRLRREYEKTDPNKKVATQKFQAFMGEIRDLSVQEQEMKLEEKFKGLSPMVTGPLTVDGKS